MKRLCFDTESNYFKPDLAVGSVEAHRDYMQARVRTGGMIRFDCGVVYDECRDRYHEFTGEQAEALVALLMTAGELISHSGKRHDLLVLEQVCGVDFVSPIWKIPHRDLFEMHNWSSVNTLAKQYIPNRLAALEGARRTRLNLADIRWPEFKPGCRAPEHFIERKLARARYDVERTYAIWAALQERG